MPLLEVERLSKSFGGVHAVRDVSFFLEEGQLLGVMGPNGSGKTTLLNLIAGAIAPDAGHIRFRGEEIGGAPPHRVCARGIARTFQLLRPFLGLSALDNVLVGQLYGRRRPRSGDAVREAERALALVGLGGKADVVASRLTAMDRKRLDLARALATSPRLLLLDEFMAGLNPTEAETAITMIERIRDEGVTVVMVEHIVWAVLNLARHLMVLSAGEKIADGAPADVVADPTVIDVYLGTSAGA